MNSNKANLFVKIVNLILFLYGIIISLIVILQFKNIIRLFSLISMYQTLERFSFILDIEFFILLIVNILLLFRLGNSIRYRSEIGRCVLISYLFLTFSLTIFQVIFRFNLFDLDFSQYFTINLIIDLVLLFFYGITLILFIVSKSIKKLFMEKGKIKIKSENTQIILKNNLKYKRKFLAISLLLIIIGLAIFTTGISKNQFEISRYGTLTYANREKNEYISFNETIQFRSTLTETWVLKNQSLMGFAYNYSDSYNLSICDLHFNQDLSKLEYNKYIETNLKSANRSLYSEILGFNQTCYFFENFNRNYPNQTNLIAINSSGVEMNRTIRIPTEFDDYFSNSYEVLIRFLEFEGEYIFMVLSASSITSSENLSLFVSYETHSFNIISVKPIIRSRNYYYEAPSTLWAILGGDPIGEELELTRSTSSISSSLYGYEILHGKLGNIEKSIQVYREVHPKLHFNFPETVIGEYTQNSWVIYPIITYRPNNTIIFEGFTKYETDPSIPNYIYINIGLVHILEGGFIIFIIIYRTDEYQEFFKKIFKKLRSPKIINK